MRRRTASSRSVSTAPLAAVAALASLATAACSTTGEAGPTPPSPSGRAAKVCRSLHGALPERVHDQRRGRADQVSDFTAVWGDPAIALRCGVPEPPVLTPGTEEYNPTAEVAEVNGVSWLLEKRDDGYRFVTTGRVAYVELTVPGDYAPEAEVLPDLADAVGRTVPTVRDAADGAGN
ncbi:hypothetical protein AN217_22735 [Streptomyces qinglanensis]|uniref:DUF3515 domain-containing protein n=1 Tax=Streptomyces qinglanensis TaxID=943816 RepID=A0A1E7K8A9_9ACTN|nr:DUF3515 domain-containing protein [Streptomyces qinglanensis]MBE9500566.1 DUF3515 domain-containing protein [Streptomyces sp. GKU 257-1]OEV00158.1 hypothetical protein AN217_22735 [Streptomyces qinglanensis]OEV28161.1 hypothetical protein AN220_02675 [Streptomyces nanshensis]